MQHALETWGYAAVFVLTLLESICIPIPSEVTLGLGGALASGAVIDGTHGDLNLGLVIVVGVLGSVSGSFVAYVVGRTAGRGVINRYGRYVRVTPSELERVEAWFDRRGERMVLYGRVVPFVRTFISLPAGVAEMKVPKFLAFTAVGVTAWVALLSSTGYALGSGWNSMTKAIGYTGYLIAVAAFAALVVLLVHRYRVRREPLPRSAVSTDLGPATISFSAGQSINGEAGGCADHMATRIGQVGRHFHGKTSAAPKVAHRVVTEAKRMTIVSGRLRARITTVVLVVSLLGGTFGIEIAASHLSGVASHSERYVPAPAAPIGHETSTHDAV
jgi:membrane protein DedA with SNARE-associated domain